MPRIVSIPSRKIEVQFPDDLPDEEIDAYLQEKYPRSGEDVAFEVDQANQQSLEGAVTVNLFEGENKMSRDDYRLLQEYKASKKSSLGDLLGVATDVAGQVFSDVGKGLTEAGAAALVGEFSPAVQSAAEGMAAGGVGLYDIGVRILNPKQNIPTKEEFLKRRIPVQGTQTIRGDFGVEDVSIPTLRPATEEDYNAFIDSEMQKDADAVNRLYLMEDILRGAPIEEIARLGQYVDPTMLAGGASTLLKTGAKTLFKKGAAKTGARTAAAVADVATPPPGAFQTIESGGTMFAAPTPGVSTAPGRLGQAALSAVETGAGAVQAVASAPGRLVNAVGNVVEQVMPGTSAPLKASAATLAMLGDAGLTAGTIAGLKTTEKTAEVVRAAANAAKGEARRAGLLERVAQNPNVSTSARKLAEGLAQLQPVFGITKRVTTQALKEGAAGAAVGAGLGYLAERNLEGAAAGAGAGTAFGGMFGAMRGTFRAGREALGYSSERTARQATGDINSFIAERPEIEQGAWATTMSRLVDVLGPEKAAAQVDAMRIAEANGARLRIATKQEMIDNPAPGWAKITGDELVINPDRILGDTAAHEATHILFSSTLNRAFKTEIENAIHGAVDPVSGEIVRPGLFTDPDLARVSELIASLYGETNSGARNRFKGYANQLRKVTDPETLAKARSAVADEFTAMYSGQLQGRLRPGRFNPDRLPLIYRRVFNSIEDSILEKLRTTLFEQGMELGFDATRGRFTDSKGRPVRIPELDAIIKRAMQPKRKSVPEAKAKPDLIPVNPADRAVWSRSYGGARGILNEDDTPKSLQQIDAEANARWQDMTSRLSALPENERIGLDFTRDDKGKTVMTAKGQLSDAAINAILSSDTLDQSAKATLREVLMSMKNFDKATFDTRYYSVYTRGRGTNKMVAGVKSASQNEILPYSVEINSKDGVIIRAVDMTKVRDRLMIALKKPQFKDLYGNAGDALKDFRAYLTNLTNISAIPSETVLGGGVRGAQKRNLFYDALGFRLRKNETLLNVPAEVINKSKNTLKSYRAERFAKLVDSGERFAFEEGTTYERVMRNFQPDAFARETLPNGEAMTNPDGYRILKQTGGKLFRVYDDKGELIGTASTETAAMKKAQSDAAKKMPKEEPTSTKRFQPLLESDRSTKWDSYPQPKGELTKDKILSYLKTARNPLSSKAKLAQFVAEYDNPQDFLDHVYFHGTGNFISDSLKPSITLSEKAAERMGGGGYGERYWAISLSKSKRKSEAFSGQNRSVRVHPVLLKKSAKVIEMKDIQDAADIEDHIIDLWKNKVDAVWIGGGEQELAVINPKAIVVGKEADSYAVFGGFKSEDFTLDKATQVYNAAKSDINSPDIRFQANPPEQTTAVPDFSKVSKKDKPILEVIYFKNQDKFKEAVAQGRIQKGVPIEKFQDMAIALHQPDSAMIGDVFMRGNKVVTSQGGVYYPVLYGDKGSLWASTAKAAKDMAVELNNISRLNNGKILMGLTSAPIDKMFSSSNIANGTMTLLYNVSQLPREYGISKSVANKILVDAINTPLVVKDKITGKKTIVTFDKRLKSSTPIEENMAIITNMLDPTQSTFPLRKHFVYNIAKSIASHLSQNKRAAKEFASLIVPESNKYANSVILKGSLSPTSIIQALGDLFSEEFTKDFQGISHPGGPNGYIYAILEMDGEVESVQTKQHGSYTHSIDSTSGQLPKVHILEKPIKWTDTIGLIQNRDYVPESIKDSVYPPSAGFSTKKHGNLMVMKPKENARTGGEITRFQPDAASPSILNGTNGTKIIKSPSGKFRVYSVTGTLLGIRDTEQAAKKLATK